MSVMYELCGVNGQLAVYENKVVITRKGALGFLSFSGAGSKTIPISSIRSVQYKAGTGWVNGYIQFGISGGRESVGGVFNAVNDENTIMLRMGRQSEMGAAIKEYIEERIISINSEKHSDSKSTSTADEILKLKQLLDMDAITSDEFEKMKKQLLDE